MQNILTNYERTITKNIINVRDEFDFEMFKNKVVSDE